MLSSYLIHPYNNYDCLASFNWFEVFANGSIPSECEFNVIDYPPNQGGYPENPEADIMEGKLEGASQDEQDD